MQSATKGRNILLVGISPWTRSNPKCYHSDKCYSGEEIEILDIIATLINATMIFKLTNVPGCGVRSGNGTWTGLMAMLETNEIDITGNLCDVSSDRANETFISYSYPVVRNKDSFLIKVPKEPSVMPEILGPFKSCLWQTILGVTIAFIIAKVVVEKFFWNIKFSTSLMVCLNEILMATFGMDGPKITFVWLTWISFIGSVTLLYSTYIKSALMKPIGITSPFYTNKELAQKLYDGQYKLLDYNQDGHYKCYKDEICDKIAQAISKHGFHHFEEPTDVLQEHNNEQALLSELFKYDNLVLLKSSYSMKTYLNDFKKRSNLWFLEDEKSPSRYMSFYYRKGLPQRRMIDDIIKMMGSFPENLHNRRNGLWRNVVQSRIIKPDTEGSQPIGITEVLSFIYCYLICTAVSGVVLGLELLLKNFQNHNNKCKR